MPVVTSTVPLEQGDGEGARDVRYSSGIPILTGSVDFWLSVSQRRGAGQEFQTCGDKEALSTTVILWRRRGNAAGLLHYRTQTKVHIADDHSTAEGTGTWVCGCGG